MTQSGAESSGETGLWHLGTGARESDIAKVASAIENLGHLAMRVITDPAEARAIVFDLEVAELTEKYGDKGATLDEIAKHAGFRADQFVSGMEPSSDNSHDPDPQRLIRIMSTDGSPVLPSDVYSEIKHRVQPGSSKAPVSKDEVLYAALHPVEPVAPDLDEPLRHRVHADPLRQALVLAS